MFSQDQTARSVHQAVEDRLVQMDSQDFRDHLGQQALRAAKVQSVTLDLGVFLVPLETLDRLELKDHGALLDHLELLE